MKVRFFLLLFSLFQGAYASKYAAIVMDVHTGAILEAHQAHSLRHPASLVKKMTLYIVFNAIKTKKLNWNSLLKVSHHAAQQMPSKLWLKPGEKVSVENLVMALIIRSANDAAVVLAEGIARTEQNFVAMMNVKAKQLGMKKTVFKNASGVPHPHQVTTAYDMALLGKALIQHCYEFYPRFKMKTFSYKGKIISSHNHLLGKVPGVDGIKTGYTFGSGYNLTASAKRHNKRLIAVVMGGNSWQWRDQHVEDLLEKHFQRLKGWQQMLINREKAEIQDPLDDVIKDVHLAKNNEKTVLSHTTIPKKSSCKKPIQDYVQWKIVDEKVMPVNWVIPSPPMS